MAWLPLSVPIPGIGGSTALSDKSAPIESYFEPRRQIAKSSRWHDNGRWGAMQPCLPSQARTIAMTLQTGTTFLLFSALAVASGCVPSKFPLSDEKTSKVDPQLFGRWVDKDDKDSFFVVMPKDGQNALEFRGAGAENPETVFATVINELHYLSLPFKDEETGRLQYHIVMYEFVDNDTLTLYVLDPKVILKAISDGELTGIIETDRFGLFTTRMERSAQMITDSRYYLVVYLKKHGKDCFLRDKDYEVTYVRQEQE
jgi:hypothetical protein